MTWIRCPDIRIVSFQKAFNLAPILRQSVSFLGRKIDFSYLYTKRLRENNFDKLRLIGYDEQNNPIIELEQLNVEDKFYICFKNYHNKEISIIRFFDENMNPAYVQPYIFMGETVK